MKFRGPEALKGLNRVHPPCTERQSLNKECGWKGGDRGALNVNNWEKEELKMKNQKTKREKK
jgi:hypothetical protein